MQEQSLENFLHIIKSATLFGMPKLLACCEYYIVLTSMIPSPHRVLRARRLREQQLCCSWGHIAEGLCMTIDNLTDP